MVSRPTKTGPLGQGPVNNRPMKPIRGEPLSGTAKVSPTRRPMQRWLLGPPRWGAKPFSSSRGMRLGPEPSRGPRVGLAERPA